MRSAALGSKLPAAGLACLCASLIALALWSPFNHDETQFVASAWLTARGQWPFVDYLYLQTPYQLPVFAVWIAAFPGHALLAARLLTGSIGALILLCVYRTQRLAGVTQARAAMACAALWLCHAFLFSVTVMRNDALPALLLALAVLVVVRPLHAGERVDPARWLALGALLGLATGIKISYAVSLGAAAAMPICWALLAREDRVRSLFASAAVATGGIAALAPLAFLRHMAPAAFDYGVAAYHATAPFAWYEANGLADRLTATAKLGEVLLVLARGPALAALAAYAIARLRSIRATRSQPALLLLLDALCLAGLVATLAPTPTWRQYAMPLLPPLFVGFGIVWQAAASRGHARGRTWQALFMLGAVVGIGQPVYQALAPLAGRIANPVGLVREAHLLGRLARARGLTGEAVTLSPQLVIDSGLSLDPRFAAGPFAYRTAGALSPSALDRLHIVSPETVGRYLQRTMPPAIVTGYENFDHVDRLGLERPLVAFAQANGYERVASPYGDAIFWLRRSGRRGGDGKE